MVERQEEPASLSIISNAAFASRHCPLQQRLEIIVRLTLFLVANADGDVTEPGHALEDRNELLVACNTFQGEAFQRSVVGKPSQIGRAEPACVESQRLQVGEAGDMVDVTTGKTRVLKGQLPDRGRAV